MNERLNNLLKIVSHGNIVLQNFSNTQTGIASYLKASQEELLESFETIRSLTARIENLKKTIADKDEEIKKIHKRYYKTFEISEEEWEEISKWQEQFRVGEFGSCGGGGYTYIFTPTGLGDFLEVRHGEHVLDLHRGDKF